jgi:hypothetical protein
MHVAIVSAAPADMLVDKPGWMADGFRQAGHDVRRCHTSREVAAADAECELVVFDQHGAGCNVGSLAELAASRKGVWVQWWRDLFSFDRKMPLAKQDHIRTFGRFLRAIDRLFVKERSQLPVYAELGIKAEYLDQACPADMPACKHAERPEWEVLVVGSASGSYRQRYLDARALAAAGHRVLWVGNGGDGLPHGVAWHPWVHPIGELPALASRAAVVLGVDYATDVPGYTSDRSWLAGGMGACFIARIDAAVYRKEMSLAELAKAAPATIAASWSYLSTEALLECVRQALASRGERQRRGRAARRRIMAEHTYRHRAEEILCRLGLEERH